MTSKGPYAGLWSHLKSIDHTLERIIKIDNPLTLTELDKDRLIALERFLKSGLEATDKPEKKHENFHNCLISSEPEYAFAIDLRNRINTISDFAGWQKSSKKGFDYKLHRLLSAIDKYLGETSTLFSKDEYKEEFKILHSIVHSLLLDAEIAMQY